MVKQSLNKVISKFGQYLNPEGDVFVSLEKLYTNTNTSALYSYHKEDGSFDYDRYKQVQEEGNKNKIHMVWALEENIKFLAEYLNKNLDDVKFALCHGTRRGKEQEWFRDYLNFDNAEVFGTEISETASQFPNTIQWDFHDTKPEWLEKTDFIYSNSFDHTYNPEKCLEAWMGCVRKGGVCILEHTDHHETESSRELDPFGAYLIQMPILINKWGQGKYGVVDVLKAPTKRDAVKFTAFLVIKKF